MSLSTSALIVGIIFLALQLLFGYFMKLAETIEGLNKAYGHAKACHYVSISCCAICFALTLFGA